MKDILSNYPTSSSLLCNYPVEAIPTYAVNEEECVMGNAPRISDIQKRYNDNCMVKWLGGMLDFFMRASSISGADNVQIGMTIQMILTRFGSLKISEMMLFAFKFLSGDFEKFYGSYDTQAITRSLAKFVEYRNDIIRRCEVRKGQEKQPRKDGRENFLIYLTSLQKAVYGDRDAREYIRIGSDRDMAIAVAMCIKRGDFPMSMMERIDPQYHELMQRTIEWDANFGNSARR